ncbi:TetR/AcrR family transcriptional regulator [Propionibacterium freudenreichii]|uniref:TetR/AcrR family transcriptional regulator n=1 Tax=Propionibacterium freudenreichii TaxID=1744 RepID=UPI0021A93EDE|nr:TetR/AcrR family transcriptional regulator [Propionibacterium freudenreichii]MCT2997243.1 TetR/AcrR family transcriptional regulator [Propionibacterium freudenreichii]MCT3001843.1 TetR/AcrR family transcriptional regulator [Propionibacterium freudenreichii]MDK9658119.1 TetR/AcrR family transcriptional regulator [Propionibacterium freudenreichii]
MAEPDEGSDIGSALSSLSAALSQLSSAVVNQTSDEINTRVTDPLRRASEQITDVAERLGGGSSARPRGIEATREALLDAAAQLFAEKGYEGTGVSEIARRAGYTKGALYANFASKQELFKALIERELARSHEDLESNLTGASMPSGADREAAQRQVLLTLEANLYAIRHPQMRDEVLADTRGQLRRIAEVIARTHGEALAEGQEPTQDYLDDAMVVAAVESFAALGTMLCDDPMVAEAVTRSRDRIIGRIMGSQD